MILTIDNNDGLGGIDYTSALLAAAPLTITRKRGAWAVCTAGLDAMGAGLPSPLSRARVLVADGSGNILFQGVLQNDAIAYGAGLTTAGQETLPRFQAVELGWLSSAAPPDALQPVTAANHRLPLSDVAVTYQPATAAALQDLSTDVTVRGNLEPGAYVTELFRGDGTTTTFALTHAPYAVGAGTLLSDAFDDTSLNSGIWTRADPGSYLGLGAGGLRMTGGNGYDATTVLSMTAPVEVGGTLVAEASGVLLTPGSDGILNGFYQGVIAHAACLAGIRVKGTGGATSLVAIINGIEQTTSYNFAAGHSYVMRVRLHCPEVQRTGEIYSAFVDGAIQQFGGATSNAPLHIVVEVLDLGLASSTLPTVLYDGALAASPQSAIFAPVNSTALVGSIASVTLAQQGTAWAVSTASSGVVTTRREGKTGTGADYALSSTGTLTFDAGRVPQPGELLTVTYRRSKSSAAHLRDANADQIRLQLALPGLPSWSGHTLQPAARSSADCNAAAQALLALANGVATHRSGEAEWILNGSGADINPGDTVALYSSAPDILLSLESVVLKVDTGAPQGLHYSMRFGQSRANNLSFTVSVATAAEAEVAIPVSTGTTMAPASLSGLQVTTATTTALQIDGGADPSIGGGFEVRSSDANFGSASTADLVLQSPVRGFSIPRAAFAERFFVRMYDGNTPRGYSSVSSVILTHLPTS